MKEEATDAARVRVEAIMLLAAKSKRRDVHQSLLLLLLELQPPPLPVLLCLRPMRSILGGRKWWLVLCVGVGHIDIKWTGGIAGGREGDSSKALPLKMLHAPLP